MRNPKLSEKLGIRPIDCLDYRLTASLVEAIGDQATQIAQKTIELNKKISKEISHFVSDLHKFAYDSHESALNALFSRDVSLAASVRAKQGTVAKVVLELEKTARTQPLEVVPHILDIASSMNRIYDHSIDIADLVMPKLA
jgi:phosphate uptake regulator